MNSEDEMKEYNLDIQEKISFVKKIYYSITNKKYKELSETKSIFAILYLAVFEILFTLIISIIAANNMMSLSILDVYAYVEGFLIDFFYNSVSLTFDTIMIISILGYLYQIIKKEKVKYSKMFCFAVYSSTLAMFIKYVVFVLNYSYNLIQINYFKYIYIVLVIIYFIKNYKTVVERKVN